MATILRFAPPPTRDEYHEARRFAAARLRTLRSRSSDLPAEEWRRITESDRPEISGRWQTSPHR